MASNKERVDYLKKLLSDNSISYNNLSEKEIKRLKTEFQLKREMEDLGIQIGTDKNLECEDGVPLSTRRPKRKRKVVNYRAPALKLDTEDEEGEENEDGKGDKDHEEEEEEEYVQDEESEESE